MTQYPIWPDGGGLDSSENHEETSFDKEFDRMELISDLKELIGVSMIAVPTFEKITSFKNTRIERTVKNAKNTKDFTGKKDEELSLYPNNSNPCKRALFIGLGNSRVDLETLRAAGGKAVKRAMANKRVKCLVIAIPDSLSLKQKFALIEGACLTNHVFNRFKSEPDKKERKEKGDRGKELKEIYFLTDAKNKKLQAGFKRVVKICTGTKIARELVSTPPNFLTPKIFADTTKEMLDEYSNVDCKIFAETEIEEIGLGGIHGVGKGSVNSPRMVIIDYNPRGAKKTVGFIGKGVTFDSGGISLKPGAGMDEMKMDMAGAGAVAGAMAAIAELQPKGVRVVAAIPLAENMPSGNALKPSDVITIYSGKTVEIGNTDAEGRLILADALAYIEKNYKPDIMIDLATLTGACVVALGENISGVFSTDDGLEKTLVEAGKTVHERCWPMPLPDDYKKLIKNGIADVHNMGTGGRWGGAIVAALFLSEFVKKTKKWAHIDIAGPALFGGSKHPYCGNTASGFGVRLLIEFLSKI